jgi:hypothetical protein
MNLLETIQDEKLKIKVNRTTYMTDVKSLFSEVDSFACHKEQEMIFESLQIIQSRNGEVKPYIESLAVGILSRKQH